MRRGEATSDQSNGVAESKLVFHNFPRQACRRCRKAAWFWKIIGRSLFGAAFFIAENF
jgi:hypothetical protein